MADKKISALDPATIPLAGTEVLPIVQSGATVKVSVANLTAGRAINATELTLTTGNLIVSDGKGIDFSATPGTGTSELLDDYEEGDWTPTLKFGNANVAMTGAFTGTYTKYGRLVTVTAIVTLTNKGSSTGSAAVGNLPFSVNTGGQGSVYYADMTGLDTTSQLASAYLTDMFLVQGTATGFTAVTEANFTNISVVIFTATYVV